jgi:hypothetical protein
VLAPVVLIIALAGAAPKDEAVDLSKRWLEGLARDEAALVALSGYPLRIRGVRPSRGEVAGCPGKPLELADAAALRKELPCLREDKILVGYIPRLRAWRRGTIQKIALGQVEPRLARYRAEVEALAASHVLVQARISDYRGFVGTVLLAVRKDAGGSLRVFAIFADKHFEDE